MKTVSFGEKHKISFINYNTLAKCEWKFTKSLGMKHFIYLRTHLEKIFLSIAHFPRNVVYIFNEYHIMLCIDRIQIEYALIYNTHFQVILPFVRFTKIVKNLSKFEYNSHFYPLKRSSSIFGWRGLHSKRKCKQNGYIPVSMKLISDYI